MRHKDAAYNRIKKLQGYLSAHPDNAKSYKKVQKFTEYFDRFSMISQPVDIDEEDPDEEKEIF